MTKRGIALDLENHHFVRELGDLTLFGTWIGADMDESEPCLAIIPRYRTAIHTHIKPACIALSSAYKYSDPKYLLAASIEFNKALGFEDSMKTVYKLADVIHSHLQDLIEMPPRPVRNVVEGGSAKLVNKETGKSNEVAIYDEY